jgi:hypothetical protein
MNSIVMTQHWTRKDYLEVQFFKQGKIYGTKKSDKMKAMPLLFHKKIKIVVLYRLILVPLALTYRYVTFWT